MVFISLPYLDLHRLSLCFGNLNVLPAASDSQGETYLTDLCSADLHLCRHKYLFALVLLH